MPRTPKDVKQEVAKMPHAIDALESNAMLWVAHPLVEQLHKTFLQAAGRRSVRAVALGPLARGKVLDVLDGIKACVSFCNQRHASERKWRVARIRTLSLSAETACIGCDPGNPLRLAHMQVVTLVPLVDRHDHLIARQAAILF